MRIRTSENLHLLLRLIEMKYEIHNEITSSFSEMRATTRQAWKSAQIICFIDHGLEFTE